MFGEWKRTFCEKIRIFCTLCVCVCVCSAVYVWNCREINAFYSVDPKVSACMTCNSQWFMGCSNNNNTSKNNEKQVDIIICMFSVVWYRSALRLPLFLFFFHRRCAFTGFRLGLIKWSEYAWNGLSAVTSYQVLYVHFQLTIETTEHVTIIS